MTYKEALQFLDSFTNYEKASGYRYTEKTFSLERMKKLLRAIGNPEKHFPSVHVAGTTGKGSTCIITASLLAASWYRVGLYTSPHLLDFCERICVVEKQDGKIVFNKVPRKFIAEQTFRMQKFLQRENLSEPPTTFELYTLLAFLYFREARVDIAVIEVGMGGRLDATNTIMPVCCAITRIGYDHTQQLGNTLEKIAHEKAGIIKCNVPVVCAPQHAKARKVIEKVCREENAPFIQVRASTKNSAGEQSFLQKYGDHQRVNVETAMAILKALEKKKLKISWNELAHLHELHPMLLPARIQKVRDNPPMFVDGGHNPPAAKSLSEFLKKNFGGKKGILIFQIFKDKEIKKVLKIILPHFHACYIPKLYYPRSSMPEELEHEVRSQKSEVRIKTFPTVSDAVASALRQKGCPFIIVTGSFYLAADALKIMGTGSFWGA